MSCRDPSEEKIVENFLEDEGLEESKKMRILNVIKKMGKLFLTAIVWEFANVLITFYFFLLLLHVCEFTFRSDMIISPAEFSNYCS